MRIDTHQMLTPNTPLGASGVECDSRPEMTSNVSPGSRKPTSSPVSANTMKQTTTSAHGPAVLMISSGSSHGMRAVWITSGGSCRRRTRRMPGQQAAWFRCSLPSGCRERLGARMESSARMTLAQQFDLLAVHLGRTGEEVVRERELFVAEGVEVGVPSGGDSAVDLAEATDDRLGDRGDDDASAVVRVAVAGDEPGALQPIDRGRDGAARGESGALGELAGGRRPLAHEQARALQVGAVEAAPLRHGVLEEHGARHEL